MSSSNLESTGQITPRQHDTDDGNANNMAGSSSSNKNVTIILSTTLPSVFLIVLAAVIFHRIRRRKARFLNRGITPIDDEEIESWKVDRTRTGEEKLPASPQTPKTPKTPDEAARTAHNPSTSVSSVQKSPSVIVYQNDLASSSRDSDDQPPWSPSYGKQSVEIPQTPVLARAPNARPGLTDEAIQGDDAYINVKRQTPRLAKAASRHARTRSTRSSYGGSTSRDPWYAQTPDQNSPRPSGDTFSKSSPSSRAGHRATISSPTNIIHDPYGDEVMLAGLSPRPILPLSDIGRAIG